MATTTTPTADINTSEGGSWSTVVIVLGVGALLYVLFG